MIVPSNAPLSTSPDDPLQYWRQGAGCETGPVKPRPDNPQIVYGVCKGEFSRLNLATGQEQQYWVYPQNRYGHASRDIRYRFQRTSPFEISPHDPKVIYHTSQVVHRTRDEGRTWEVISPDLTANLPEGQGIVRRADHPRHHRRGSVRDHLRVRGVAAREGRALVGRQRRAGVRVAR